MPISDERRRSTRLAKPDCESTYARHPPATSTPSRAISSVARSASQPTTSASLSTSQLHPTAKPRAPKRPVSQLDHSQDDDTQPRSVSAPGPFITPLGGSSASISTTTISNGHKRRKTSLGTNLTITRSQGKLAPRSEPLSESDALAISHPWTDASHRRVLSSSPYFMKVHRWHNYDLFARNDTTRDDPAHRFMNYCCIFDTEKIDLDLEIAGEDGKREQEKVKPVLLSLIRQLIYTEKSLFKPLQWLAEDGKEIPPIIRFLYNTDFDGPVSHPPSEPTFQSQHACNREENDDAEDLPSPTAAQISHTALSIMLAYTVIDNIIFALRADPPPPRKWARPKPRDMVELCEDELADGNRTAVQMPVELHRFLDGLVNRLAPTVDDSSDGTCPPLSPSSTPVRSLSVSSETTCSSTRDPSSRGRSVLSWRSPSPPGGLDDELEDEVQSAMENVKYAVDSLRWLLLKTPPWPDPDDECVEIRKNVSSEILDTFDLSLPHNPLTLADPSLGRALDPASTLSILHVASCFTPFVFFSSSFLSGPEPGVTPDLKDEEGEEDNASKINLLQDLQDLDWTKAGDLIQFAAPFRARLSALFPPHEKKPTLKQPPLEQPSLEKKPPHSSLAPSADPDSPFWFQEEEKNIWWHVFEAVRAGFREEAVQREEGRKQASMDAEDDDVQDGVVFNLDSDSPDEEAKGGMSRPRGEERKEIERFVNKFMNIRTSERGRSVSTQVTSSAPPSQHEDEAADELDDPHLMDIDGAEQSCEDQSLESPGGGSDDDLEELFGGVPEDQDETMLDADPSEGHHEFFPDQDSWQEPAPSFLDFDPSPVISASGPQLPTFALLDSGSDSTMTGELPYSFGGDLDGSELDLFSVDLDLDWNPDLMYPPSTSGSNPRSALCSIPGSQVHSRLISRAPSPFVKLGAMGVKDGKSGSLTIGTPLRVEISLNSEGGSGPGSTSTSLPEDVASGETFAGSPAFGPLSVAVPPASLEEESPTGTMVMDSEARASTSSAAAIVADPIAQAQVPSELPEAEGMSLHENTISSPPSNPLRQEIENPKTPSHSAVPEPVDHTSQGPNSPLPPRLVSPRRASDTSSPRDAAAQAGSPTSNYFQPNGLQANLLPLSIANPLEEQTQHTSQPMGPSINQPAILTSALAISPRQSQTSSSPNVDDISSFLPNFIQPEREPYLGLHESLNPDSLPAFLRMLTTDETPQESGRTGARPRLPFVSPTATRRISTLPSLTTATQPGLEYHRSPSPVLRTLLASPQRFRKASISSLFTKPPSSLSALPPIQSAEPTNGSLAELEAKLKEVSEKMELLAKEKEMVVQEKDKALAEAKKATELAELRAERAEMKCQEVKKALGL